MSLWLIAVAAGLALAVVQYGWRDLRTTAGVWPPAILRAVAATLVVALVLDAPAARAKPAAAWAAVDGSLSLVRGAGTDSAVLRGVRTATADVHAESTFTFGDSLRPFQSATRDVSTQLQPAVDRAVAAGHPLVVITDGELDDADALRSLPAGSRIVTVPRPRQPDLAVATLEAPRLAVSGDTAEIKVGLVAGSGGARRGALTLLLDDRPVARVNVDSLPSFAERSIALRAVLSGTAGPVVLRAVASSADDAEPHNDTLSAAIDVSRAASAVFISTSPDYDARYALAVLRGALAIPTRAFFRVAPGQWRLDGPLTAVPEDEVRRAFHDAPVAILHGDTSIFGPPRTAALGPIALVVPPSAEDGEWYAADAPVSPLSPALSGLPWDSLPPLSVPETQPSGRWKAAEARRGRSTERRVFIAGSDEPRRVVTISAAGLWRWRLRGGAAEDAYTALWGGIFDWLAAERADKRAAVPDERLVRAGDVLRWRRGSPNDSVVTLAIRQRNAASRVDSVTVRFGPNANVAETPSRSPGVYEVSMPGGRALLVVNGSREWLPRPPVPTADALKGAASASVAPGMRTMGWVYAVAIALLCVEWFLRRRRGMR